MGNNSMIPTEKGVVVNDGSTKGRMSAFCGIEGVKPYHGCGRYWVSGTAFIEVFMILYYHCVIIWGGGGGTRWDDWTFEIQSFRLQ